MLIGKKNQQYEWIDNWAVIPDTPSGKADGRTHGVEVTKDGRVIVFNQADPAVLIFDADGKLQSSWGDRFAGAHGLTIVEEHGVEYLWLADVESHEVVKTTLEGKTVARLKHPNHPVYKDGGFVPTWVAVNEERRGGNGDIWVADGYGKFYVHRYNSRGEYISSINGEEGSAGAFKCPHGIWFDDRKTHPELYIADRGHHRVQVYDAEGNFQRAFGEDFLTSPCSFASDGELLIIPELRARVTILNANDQPVAYLGENESIVEVEGWPNLRDRLEPGKFNSPHDADADAQGNIYVSEWIIGGRITKLVKQHKP